MSNRKRKSYCMPAQKIYPIQPISDGCLTIAALYVYSKFQKVSEISPAEFLERIAFANYCKYSIQAEQNQDYANNPDYLAESHRYIAGDIEILKPHYIVMPKTIYWTDRTFIDSIRGSAKIIPIYQINARNINLRIKKYSKAFSPKLDMVLLDWYNHLGKHGITGKTKENFFSIFDYLDYVMQNEMVE